VTGEPLLAIRGNFLHERPDILRNFFGFGVMQIMSAFQLLDLFEIG
jgi:hypothetical protein